MQKVEAHTSETARSGLIQSFQEVRERTEALAAPITSEDAQIQSMPDVSPTKWHLGHTSWFFETFLLREIAGRSQLRSGYETLFNSYYNAVGPQHPRARRGLLSRPSLDEVMEYRRLVTADAVRVLSEMDEDQFNHALGVVTVGLHHEQQHQELLLTDILHVYWSNPLRPAYSERTPPVSRAEAFEWTSFDEGLQRIGHEGPSFAFDNEYPRHREFVEAFEIANRTVTAGEFLEFMEAGGYREPEHWLSDGWHTVQTEQWDCPMYWERLDGAWYRMTLHGMLPVDPDAPVCHISYYEADAFARWRGARLPSEAEWELAFRNRKIRGNFQDDGIFVPFSYRDEPVGGHETDEARGDGGEAFGNTWEWTKSAYLGYPGYRVSEGALGEYNGKFMCNQFVLRGGSVATPQSHIRASYRNFFPPEARWQFKGMRLARDVTR